MRYLCKCKYTNACAYVKHANACVKNLNISRTRYNIAKLKLRNAFLPHFEIIFYYKDRNCIEDFSPAYFYIYLSYKSKLKSWWLHTERGLMERLPTYGKRSNISSEGPSSKRNIRCIKKTE